MLRAAMAALPVPAACCWRRTRGRTDRDGHGKRWSKRWSKRCSRSSVCVDLCATCSDALGTMQSAAERERYGSDMERCRGLPRYGTSSGPPLPPGRPTPHQHPTISPPSPHQLPTNSPVLQVAPLAGAGIAAGILLALAAGIRVLASQIRKQANGDLPAGLSAGFAADEDDVHFDGCCSLGAIDFVYSWLWALILTGPRH